MNLSEELSKLDIRPFGCRIIVKEKVLEKVGMIVMPKTEHSMKPTEGMVLAIGEDVTTVKPGDDVFYGRYSGIKIQRGGEEFYLMNDEDILCEVVQMSLEEHEVKQILGGKHG